MRRPKCGIFERAKRYRPLPVTNRTSMQSSQSAHSIVHCSIETDDENGTIDSSRMEMRSRPDPTTPRVDCSTSERIES